MYTEVLCASDGLGNVLFVKINGFELGSDIFVSKLPKDVRFNKTVVNRRFMISIIISNDFEYIRNLFEDK